MPCAFGLFGALADHVPLQRDAATSAVSLDLVVERLSLANGRVVGRVDAFHVGLERRKPQTQYLSAWRRTTRRLPLVKKKSTQKKIREG
jgi:hypothetical protein